MVVISIPWLVLQVTDSPAFAGLVLAASALPALVVSPLGGAFINRFGNRTVSITADVLSMLSVMAFPIVNQVAGLSGVAILVIAVLGAAFDPIGYTARKTLITTVSEKAKFDVEKHNGIHEGLFGASWIAGPAIGAWLIALVGPVNSFWVAGAFSAVAALMIVLLRVSSPLGGHEVPEGDTSSKNEFTRGFGIIWQDKLIRVILLSVLVIAAVYLPTESVVLPAFYESISDPAQLGLVISVLAAGSAISAFGYGWIITKISGRSLIRLAFFGASVSTLAMSFLPDLPLMLVAAFFLGFFWGPFNPFLNSLTQQRIPEYQHGAVYGATTSVFYAAPPIGMLVTGYLVEELGIQFTYHALASLLVLTSLIVLSTKTLREQF